LPILDFDGQICSLQCEAPDGQKKLFPGGRKKGCHIPVSGSLDSSAPLLVCEGFATACRVAATPPESCTIAAIDAGNLRNVCIGSRLKWLDREICVFGDDDKSHRRTLAELRQPRRLKSLIASSNSPRFLKAHRTIYLILTTCIVG
jgi:putative DNA primase/helicase